jgi:hypothetical protein
MDARLGRGLGHMRRLSDGGVALNVPHLVLEPGGSEGVRFFSLQLSAAAREASASITDLAPELTDFAQTAGAIAKLDLVISLDTAIAHLAGAMGSPFGSCRRSFRTGAGSSSARTAPGIRRRACFGKRRAVIGARGQRCGGRLGLDRQQFLSRRNSKLDVCVFASPWLPSVTGDLAIASLGAGWDYVECHAEDRVNKQQ